MTITKTKSKIIFTIIIPAYKEQKFIGNTLRILKDYLESNEIYDVSEVIVVSADSGDNTQLIAKQFQDSFAFFKLIKPGIRVGKGRDVRLGMLESRGEFVIFMDADLATPINHLFPALDLIRSGQYDVVVGVRNLHSMHEDLLRKVTSKLSNGLIRLLIDPRLKDSQCGFKAFNGVVAREMFSKSVINGWGFDFEIMLMVKILKYRLYQYPINDWLDPKGSDGLSGDSQLSAIKTTLIELFKVKYYQIKGYYK